MAAEISGDHEGGGITTLNKVIIPFYGPEISKPLRILTEEDNAGACELRRPSDEPECYRYKNTVSFRPGPNPSYYDIYAVLHGTDHDDGPSIGIHSVAGIEVFRFVNGAYTRIEKCGSITNREKAMRQ